MSDWLEYGQSVLQGKDRLCRVNTRQFVYIGEYSVFTHLVYLYTQTMEHFGCLQVGHDIVVNPLDTMSFYETFSELLQRVYKFTMIWMRLVFGI